ncbi:hypothetical protein [Kribbella sancticallisti]|uniref:hypothetical protein n=1 Tax=Kribbella sancticallisti TaxID=460087 RepID=UPI0031D8CDFA
MRTGHHSQGIGCALLVYAIPLTGAQRVDPRHRHGRSVYRTFEHHTFSGFRIHS